MMIRVFRNPKGESAMDKLRNSAPSVLLDLEKKKNKGLSKNIRSSNGAVIWGRVSSADQDEDGFSKDAQVKYLRKYALREGLDVVREFAPVESAFQETDRDIFDEMVAFVRASKKVRHILVEKTDRLHRSEQRKMKIKELVDRYGIWVHFVREGRVYSRDSRSHEIFGYNINSAVSNYYSQVIGEEASKGMREKAEQGIYPSNAPLGYLNENKMIVIDKKRAPLIKKLFETYGTGGHSLKETAGMARSLGLSYRESGSLISKSTLGAILKNPIYTGWFIWKGRLHHGSHEPIVSVEMFERVQNVFKDRNASKPRCMTRVFAYSQLIKCAKCGCLIVGEIKKGKYIYYHCSNFKGECKEAGKLKYVREEAVEKQFMEMLGRFGKFDGKVLEWAGEVLRLGRSGKRMELEDAIMRLRKELETLENRIEGAYIDKLDGKITWERYEAISKRYEGEKKRCADNIRRHDRAKGSYMKKEADILALVATPQMLLTHLNDTGKRRLLRLLFTSIKWHNGEIVTEFHEVFNMLTQADGMARMRASLKEVMTDEQFKEFSATAEMIRRAFEDDFENFKDKIAPMVRRSMPSMMQRVVPSSLPD